jgi:putative acetyltransferase
MNKMHIRKFRRGDEKELWNLFYNTIHNVNIRDYNKAQVAAWAPYDLDINYAIQKFRKIEPFVVIKDGKIIGYADIQSDGYIDHFYCHHEFQGQGVGSMLFAALEKEARENGILEMYSNVSITARPFFEAMGFSVEKEQLIQVGDQRLKNYRMVRRHGLS